MSNLVGGQGKPPKERQHTHLSVSERVEVIRGRRQSTLPKETGRTCSGLVLLFGRGFLFFGTGGMETFLRLFLFYLSGGEASEWKQFGKERKFLFDVSRKYM